LASNVRRERGPVARRERQVILTSKSVRQQHDNEYRGQENHR
jgi:hypothetical protein